MTILTYVIDILIFSCEHFHLNSTLSEIEVFWFLFFSWIISLIVFLMDSLG